MEENIPELGYQYSALEPFIDEETMRVHHDKHFKGYFDKYKKALEAENELSALDVQEVLSNLEKVPESIRQTVINNGGGYLHHRFFFSILKKDVNFSGIIADKIIEKWGSYEIFKEELSKVALNVFGSGWAFLVLNQNKELEIVTSKNQDSPVSQGNKLLIAIDVWEHSYYLKYQNRRNDFVENFFKVINWEKVNELYQESI